MRSMGLPPAGAGLNGRLRLGPTLANRGNGSGTSALNMSLQALAVLKYTPRKVTWAFSNLLPIP